jgi:Mn-dependent DtxR family transcriptional regulator
LLFLQKGHKFVPLQIEYCKLNKILDISKFRVVHLSLVLYCIKHKVPQLKTYLALRYLSNTGVVREGNAVRAKVAELLGISELTVRNDIQTLKKMGWITHIGKNIFIKNQSRIVNSYDLRDCGVIEYNYRDLANYNSFTATIALNSILKFNKSRWRKLDTNIRKGHCDQGIFVDSVALRNAAEFLGVSHMTIARMKKKAEKAGYIRVRKHIVPLQEWTEELDNPNFKIHRPKGYFRFGMFLAVRYSDRVRMTSSTEIRKFRSGNFVRLTQPKFFSNALNPVI